MTQTYTANKIYSSDKEAEAQVLSKNCRYVVWKSNGEIFLYGPGVQEVTDDEGLKGFDSFEDFAIHVVLLFENGLWPEE